jgi:integrase
MKTLYKRPNGIYYHVVVKHGRRIYQSTGAKTKSEAEKFLSKNSNPIESISYLTLSKYAPQFFAYANTNLAPGTVLLYEQVIRVFIRIIGDFKLTKYTIRDVELFKTSRLKEVSPVKVNIDFRTLKALFQTALRWKLITENPFHGVKQIKIPPRRPIYLTKEEFKKLMNVVNNPWFKDLIMFAIATMMRAGEITSLNWQSVDLLRRVIMIENQENFRIKTSKPRIIPMNQWVYEFLSSRKIKEGNVFTFGNRRQLSVRYVSGRFKKYVKKAEINQAIHFHSLRHTGASWLVQDGVSIYAIQRILGHSSISMTQVYSHLEAESLFQSVNKITFEPDATDDQMLRNVAVQ